MSFKILNPKTAIIGATGAVGSELLKIFDEKNFQFSSLHLVASERSEGKRILFRNKVYTVEALQKFDFTQVDLAFFSAGTSTSKTWVTKAIHAGVLVIDNTNAYRMDPLTPLLVPQVNPHRLLERPISGIIANPNCSTIQMVRVLKPIEDQFGIEQVVASTYQASSGGGLTGIQELKDDCMKFLNKQGPSQPKRFSRNLGFNVIPQVDIILDSGFTLEEQKMIQETKKILERPNLKLTATAVRVPVINSHSEAVYIETKEKIDYEKLLSILESQEELRIYRDPTQYPTPRFNEMPDFVHVGRVRINPENNKGVWLWIVADNLRIGAALNAYQIAEKICTF